MYVGHVDKMSGNTSFTITFGNEVYFRTLFVLFEMANSNIPIFTIIGLQFTSDDGNTPMATYKNLMTRGVTDATVNGRTLTITLDANNWGDLYGMCSAGSFHS